MIRQAFAALAALTVSSAAATHVGFSGHARVDLRENPAAIPLPVSVGTAKSNELWHPFGPGSGLGLPATTAAPLRSKFTAWLSRLGFIIAKESK